MSKISKIQSGAFTWTNIDHPTKEVLEEVNKEYEFHHLCIDDCLSGHQRAKIDEYEDYLFIILHFPCEVSHAGDKEIEVDEIDIFIGQDFFITVHDGSKRLDDIFQECEKDENVLETYMGKGTGYFLYKLLNRLMLDMFPI